MALVLDHSVEVNSIFNTCTKIRDYCVCTKLSIGRPRLYSNLAICDGVYMSRIYGVNLPFSIVMSKML
jgi:hypothetical protein